VRNTWKSRGIRRGLEGRHSDRGIFYYGIDIAGSSYANMQ